MQTRFVLLAIAISSCSSSTVNDPRVAAAEGTLDVLCPAILANKCLREVCTVGNDTAHKVDAAIAKACDFWQESARLRTAAHELADAGSPDAGDAGAD